jgi:hypothetical protein
MTKIRFEASESWSRHLGASANLADHDSEMVEQQLRCERRIAIA